MHVPGYGQRFRAADFISGHDHVAELALFVRGHEPNSRGRYEPPNGPTLWGYKIYDEHEYAYRGVYLDCVRGIDFLRSRPEIDSQRIGVMGGSQGGGLTLATAGLCGSKIAACAYWDPWPCDLRDHMQIRTMIHGELQRFRDYYDNKYSVDQFEHVLDLVDTRNFGPAITCPVLFCAGLFDDDCPPHIGFAVYNGIKTAKRYVVYPGGSHIENQSFEQDARAFFKSRFKF
jgi:cephalosporin-C deacetylase-like acetyl esterase